jgi:hypothetical protein
MLTEAVLSTPSSPSSPTGAAPAESESKK